MLCGRLSAPLCYALVTSLDTTLEQMLGVENATVSLKDLLIGVNESPIRLILGNPARPHRLRNDRVLPFSLPLAHQIHKEAMMSRAKAMGPWGMVWLT